MARGAPKPAQIAQKRQRLHAFWRPLLLGLGFVCLGIGVVGLVLPLVPGTVFLILSAACFTRSSPRFEAWLLDHTHLGPPVRQWRQSGSIPRHVKTIAVVSLTASWLILFETDAPEAVKWGCLPVFLAVAAYVVTRPEGT